jgi:hypothetical protein
MAKGHGSKGYISGSPGSVNLSKWTNHGQLGTEREYPTRDNQDPDAVVYRDSDGRVCRTSQTYSKCDESPHKFPSMSKGAGAGGEARISLTKVQRKARGGK